MTATRAALRGGSLGSSRAGATGRHKAGATEWRARCAGHRGPIAARSLTNRRGRLAGAPRRPPSRSARAGNGVPRVDGGSVPKPSIDRWPARWSSYPSSDGRRTRKAATRATLRGGSHGRSSAGATGRHKGGATGRREPAFSRPYDMKSAGHRTRRSTTDWLDVPEAARRRGVKPWRRRRPSCGRRSPCCSAAAGSRCRGWRQAPRRGRAARR